MEERDPLLGPEIIAIAAQSLDGFIATDSDQFINWTSKEDKRHFAKHTTEAGVIIVGRRTYETFPITLRPLKNRLNFVLTNNPQTLPEHPDIIPDNSPLDILRELDRRACRRAFVIGGASVYRQFLEQKLIEQLWLTVEPVILGDGIKLFNGLSHLYRFELLACEPLTPGSNSALLKYKIKYHGE